MIRTILLATALIAAMHGARAGDQEHFAAALERAELQYRIALRTLETGGRDETAAEVRLLREIWQQVTARVADHHAAPTADGPTVDAENAAATATQIDTLLVGALIVIDIGSRDAARSALAPVGETLARLRQRTTPP